MDDNKIEYITNNIKEQIYELDTELQDDRLWKKNEAGCLSEVIETEK